MITELLLLALIPMLTGMLGAIPASTVDLGSLAVVVRIADSAAMLNGFFPVATLGTCLGLIFGLKTFMFGYRIVLFVFHQFWGSD